MKVEVGLGIGAIIPHECFACKEKITTGWLTARVRTGAVGEGSRREHISVCLDCLERGPELLELELRAWAEELRGFADKLGRLAEGPHLLTSGESEHEWIPAHPYDMFAGGAVDLQAWKADLVREAKQFRARRRVRERVELVQRNKRAKEEAEGEDRPATKRRGGGNRRKPSHDRLPPY